MQNITLIHFQIDRKGNSNSFFFSKFSKLDQIFFSKFLEVDQSNILAHDKILGDEYND